jgi:hypothetical protein
MTMMTTTTTMMMKMKNRYLGGYKQRFSNQPRLLPILLRSTKRKKPKTIRMQN